LPFVGDFGAINFKETIKFNKMEKHLINHNTANDGNMLLCTVASFLDWKEQQRKRIRGGKIMYDVKGYYKYLHEHELFEYWSVRNCA
jgi:hypothetical protein